VGSYAAGSFIFKEGETGDLMFAALEGKMKLAKG
jgi:hypothetical protein